MGDTFPASLAGRRQEISTVTQAKTAEPMKMMGLAETTASPSIVPMSTGTSTLPSSQPRIRPMGMPMMQSLLACP